MIYLSGVSKPELQAALPRYDLGLMWTPKAYAPGQHPAGTQWGADNGCFTLGERFVPAAWLRWLDRMRPLAAHCLFAVAPDVVGDAAATLTRSAPHFDAIRQLGYPVGFVLQNGQEELPMPWDAIDAVFIGGDDTWKLGKHAAALVYEAKARGKWAHCGRVNSKKRLVRAAVMGCDSADGTFLRWGKPGENMPRMTRWLRELNHRPVIDLNTADFGASA